MNQPKFAINLLLLAAGSALVPPAQAQAPAPAPGAGTPEEVALDALRTRSEIPANDPTIEAWMTYRLNKLMSGLQDPAFDAGSEFLKAYQTQAADAANSASFKTRLAEQSSKRFAAEFQKGADLEPTAAMILARALLQLENVATMDGLTAGLKAKSRPAVRYYSAKVLAALIPAIQADQGLTATTIQMLREVGAQETSGVVLSQIYEAMFYRERLPIAVPALLDVLVGQLKRRAKEGPVAGGAEEVLLTFFKKELANIPDKNRLVAVLAMLLRMDVERYLTENVRDEEKRVLERSIDAKEALLMQIVAPAPPPNVREAMKKEENRDINMPLELNQWIGTAQTPGVLNAPPWSVPVGAPIPD